MANTTSASRDIQLHEPAVDFIDNRLFRYHAAFANSSGRFDPVRGQYIDSSQAASAMPIATNRATTALDDDRLPQKQFIEAMTLLQDTPVRLKAEIKFNIRGKADWDKVIQEVQQAQEAYNNPSGFWAPIRKGVRKLGDKSGVVEPFLEFIPDGDYTSILSGGLKVIISVWIVRLWWKLGSSLWA
jgi:hypothetical protein